jgi:hypothetical protein
MSRNENHGRTAARTFLFLAMLTTGSLLPAHAQYVGRVDANQDTNAPTLRATAVLEYTGDLAKPTASRLVPIAVWDGERYQPGGLYLAQPVPLTVESGTQYVLQVAGTPKGLFDVKAASDVGGSWIAIGNFQKPAAPNYAKLKRSRNLPRIVSDADNDKPHFAHRPAADSGSASAGTKGSSPTNAPSVDPDRPTLHKRSDTAGTPSDAGTTTATNSAPSVDPDRPILHKPSESSGSGAPETATDAIDPNRPHLEYGRPADLESLDGPSPVQIAKLAGHPENLEEIAAVSDARTPETHSYVYSWTDLDDKTKMQTALEAIAQKLVAQSPQNVTKSVTNSSTTRKTTRRTAARKAVKPAFPALTDEQFNAYELSYGGGATLVFSATSGQGDAAKYITLIAQPDFNGTPIVLYKQIATQRDLDIIPRMKLIDAVDTDNDNRAELIFALESKTGRQYAIYRVANSRVEQVFTTGS